MQDVQQTKEGFIKSMILFVVLLGICFAPFFAFAQTVQTVAVSAPAAINVADNISKEDLSDAGNREISFELGIHNNQLKVEFTTAFKCASYAIEGKMDNQSAYTTVVYCNDALCMDPRKTVTALFGIKEHPYTAYRIKTTLLNGDIVYSEEKQKPQTGMNAIELINTAVADKLHIKINADANFTYSVSNIKGENISNGEISVSQPDLDFSNCEAGFYIISFTAKDGKVYHYKFFKTVNL